MNVFTSYKGVINSMGSEINIITSNEDLNSLLSSGGMWNVKYNLVDYMYDFWWNYGSYRTLRSFI